MTEIGKLLRSIRGKDSLRTASEKTGLSHGYISIVEKGVDPRTKSPILPSPETLKAYANGYIYSYEELMRAAGYIDVVAEEQGKYITNDQAKNAVLEKYARLPQEKKKIIDDLLDKLEKL